MILCVPPHQARSLWPLVEPILKRATDRTNGRVSPDALLNWIERGSMQLWIGGEPVRAVMTGEFVTYPHGRSYRATFAAGDLALLREGMPVLKAWTKSRGATSIEIEGRKGWSRALPDFREEAVILRMEL